jgi:hypothetical protein
MITKRDIERAQERWGNAIVDIGRVYTGGGDVVGCAENHIEALYAYGKGTVLFKPTKCVERPFRPTLRSALSYFVGDARVNDGFPEDAGFAIAPYLSVRFDNADTIPGDGRGLAMGRYYFTKTDGELVMVEYTFGYRRVDKAVLIDVHHSSLPYQPPKSYEQKSQYMSTCCALGRVLAGCGA